MNITNDEIGNAASKYSKVEDEHHGVGVNATKFNAFTAGAEYVLNRLKEETAKDLPDERCTEDKHIPGCSCG